MRLTQWLFAAALLAGCSPQDAQDADLGTKRIAITYDDAPRGDGEMFSGIERTAQLIASLEAADSGPVAMFVTTQGMDTEEGRARVQAYADAGHVIANHSDTHPWASEMTMTNYLADIDAAEAKLDSLGISARFQRSWFRNPYLDEGDTIEKRDALREGLVERGLTSGYVTVDTYDWHLESLAQTALRDGREVDMEALERVYVAMVVDAAEHYDAMARDVLDRRPAHTLLVHENDIGAKFADEMIDALRGAGWQIIHPDEAFADSISKVAPDTLFSGMGRVAAIAKDKGLSGPEVFDHWSASREGIEARAEAEGVFPN